MDPTFTSLIRLFSPIQLSLSFPTLRATTVSSQASRLLIAQPNPVHRLNDVAKSYLITKLPCLKTFSRVPWFSCRSSHSELPHMAFPLLRTSCLLLQAVDSTPTHPSDFCLDFTSLENFPWFPTAVRSFSDIPLSAFAYRTVSVIISLAWLALGLAQIRTLINTCWNVRREGITFHRSFSNILSKHEGDLVGLLNQLAGLPPQTFWWEFLLLSSGGDAPEFALLTRCCCSCWSGTTREDLLLYTLESSPQVRDGYF